MQSIGIMLNTISASIRTEELLKQSQSLTSELQSQQLELKQTNDELEEKARLLQERNAEIERRTREIEEARTELEKKAEQLSLTSKYKSQFLANMSHELRTPLNSLLILSKQLADNSEGNMTRKQIEFAQTIRAAGSDLLTLINDILDLSKIEAGRLELRDERVDLGSVIKSSLILINDRANESGVEVASSVPTPAPVIRGDERSIKQILLNLLSNAVKFTPIGGRILVDVFLDATGGIVLTVKDTGIGMSPGDIPKAMQPFGQLGDVHTRNRSGTGLGLPIVKSLVEMHDAEFRLTSELGVGSAAEISFPARRVIGA
jgi:signal transduction histidine kinase